MKRGFLTVFFCLILFLLIFSGCGENAFESLSDDSSDEACQYETAQDLDDHKYDAVLNSPCADALQKGAAYAGKAGYDIQSVINIVIEASEETEPLTLFMSDLTGAVDEDNLDNLENSKTEYASISQSDELYEDAQFYLALVQAVNGLSLIKIVIDSDGDGNFVDCDVDATVTALYATSQQNCGGLSCTWPATDVTFSNQGKSGTYRVLPVTSAIPLCTGTFNKLLFFDTASIPNQYSVAITSGECQGDDGNLWPCPREIGGNPVGFVGGLDTALSDSITGLEESVGLGVSTDLTNEMRDIRRDACGGTTVADPCTDSEVGDYISTLL